MTFRNVAIFAAAICLGLTIVWAAAPAVLLGFWGVPLSDSHLAQLLGRRTAALFAAFAMLFLSARDLPPSPPRTAICMAFIGGCVLLAVSGLFDLIAGRAGVGILSAVVTELAIAAVLWRAQLAP